MKSLIRFLAIILIMSHSVQAQDTLKILSWNVFLRPAIMHDQQMKRVDSIANYLIESDADILVLQEVFHGRARNRLIALLGKTYRDQTIRGPKTIYGVPSGVMICTRQKFKEEWHFSYKSKTGSDGLARKGVVAVPIVLNGKELVILGTHLQAGSGEKRREIRKKQVETIGEVQSIWSDSSVIIYAGDFNIGSTTPAYDSLIKTLKADNFELTSEIKNTSNFSNHQLMESDGQPNWIDFILLKEKENAEIVSSMIESPRQILKGESQRLSDHNPIISTLVLN